MKHPESWEMGDVKAQGEERVVDVGCGAELQQPWDAGMGFC